jgi:hypothetical protein
MSATVKLDHDGRTVTVEIGDITSDELLAAKMNPQSAASELFPKDFFVGCLISAQFRGPVGCLLD